MYCNNNKMFAALILFSLMLLFLDSADSMSFLGIGKKHEPTNDSYTSNLSECTEKCKDIGKNGGKNNCHGDCEWESSMFGGGSCVPSKQFKKKLAVDCSDIY